MKILFTILIFIHGLIHILGFIKGFEVLNLEEFSQPVSKPMGLLWLISAIFIFVYGGMQFLNSSYDWIMGFIAVTVSQFLIFIWWTDAGFGTLTNLVILLVSLISYGNFRFQKLVKLETDEILRGSEGSKGKIITEDDIVLPVSVKKWLQNSGVMGRPYLNSGKVMQKIKMKLSPKQKKWFHATAIQYSTIDIPAFIWTTKVKMNGIINFQGRDKFKNGKGEMLIKLNSLINIVNEKGERLNEGTLQRYLGEMVWFPSLALSPYITWQHETDTSATATMVYKGTRGSGTFYFNSQGDFIKFSALRYKDNEPEAKRYKWILTVEEHGTFDGIKVPSKVKATWELENQEWTWLQLEVTDITYNVSSNHSKDLYGNNA